MVSYYDKTYIDYTYNITPVKALVIFIVVIIGFIAQNLTSLQSENNANNDIILVHLAHPAIYGYAYYLYFKHL